MSPHARKPRLLVVDDDPDLQDAVKDIAEDAGFEVVQAYDGDEGLRLTLRTTPDIVLLDVCMPRLDGRDVLIQLKRDDLTRDIPVIIYSARNDQTDRLLGLELGAEEYIGKPFDIDLLMLKLASILNRDGASAHH